MSDFIGVYPKAAPDDYCDRMIAKFDQLEKTMSGDRGETRNGGIRMRKDVAFGFQRDAEDLAWETNSILDKSLALYMDRHPGLAMEQFYSHLVKVQKTKPGGGFHKWHSERSNDNSTRVLVWMIYLNTCNEDEGTTEFIEQGRKLKAEKGTVVFFPADWTHAHRGNPVYTSDKYIATGWYFLNEQS